MILNGRYQVKERLGEGGMGLVCRATDLRLNRDVAVKMLRPQYAGDPEFVQRFNQEATAAAQLAHPNIAQVFDTGRDGDTRYIVMELLKPFTLKNLIAHAAGGKLTPEDAIRYTIEIARALGHAHTHGVVHRDIKPQNILFTDDGHVKVTDFGIARAMSSTSSTATGTVLGSPHYLSPEQAHGQAAGPSSDIYSLGVVLYEMLTGRPPFTGETPLGIAVQHLRTEAPPVRALAPQVPVGLEQVVQRALAKTPEERFATATEFAAALDAARGGRLPSLPSASTAADATQLLSQATLAAQVAPAGGPAHPLLPREPQARPARPNPIATGAVVVVVLVGLALGVLFATRPGPQPPTPTTPTGPTKRQIVVENLQGKDLATERARIEASYREQSMEPPQLVEVGREPNPAPAGQILRQAPEPGGHIDEGGVIKVWVSSGVEEVLVPDVVAMTLDEAKATLLAKNLTVGQVAREHNDQYDTGIVIGQAPAGGAKLPKNGPVTLTVSQGKKPPPTSSGRSKPDIAFTPLVETEAGKRQTTVTVTLPAGGAAAAVELKWLKGDTGSPGGGIVEPGKDYATMIEGNPGSVLAVMVDGEVVKRIEF